MNRYEVIIYWSVQDEIYVAEIPELQGCKAHGETQAEALKQVDTVAKEWIKLAEEKRWDIPEPKGRLMYA